MILILLQTRHPYKS